MAHPSTLYRFRIDLSDIDRGVYENLDLRVAMHPSETTDFLLTRILAFALNSQPGLEFAPGGLSDTDEPCLRVPNPHGSRPLSIEVGIPSAKRLHKTSKASAMVKVYTYKDPTALIEEMRRESVHRAHEIGVFSFDSRFLKDLAGLLRKDNRWSLIHNEGSLSLTATDSENAGRMVSAEVHRHSVPS